MFIGYTIYIMVRRDQNNTSSTALNEFLSFIYTVAYGVVFVIYLFFGVRIYLSIYLSNNLTNTRTSNPSHPQSQSLTMNGMYHRLSLSLSLARCIG